MYFFGGGYSENSMSRPFRSLIFRLIIVTLNRRLQLAPSLISLFSACINPLLVESGVVQQRGVVVETP